ncbi:amidophosphoribosyltransferase [Oleispirillum naphthae]|uniref:amidophosphoribosyltransferase n=1 Tax=Oleispirillum naphthae TaxID=2838853 RepID=UPI0030823926
MMTPCAHLSTQPFDDDHLKEECGVFGVFGTDDAARLTTLGLHSLQHRGQEAAGIVARDGERFNAHKGMGHVAPNFSSEAVINGLAGNSAIGHVRYSTTGETILRNVQPLFAEFESGGFAIAHNGNLTNAMTLRRSLIKRGCLFQSTSDTEVIVHLIATSLESSIPKRVIDALRQVKGAYSLVMLSTEAVIGVRDPAGVRPLVIGKMGDAFVLASETCALEIIGADFLRDVEPGEVVIIDEAGLHSQKPFPALPQRLCIFEYIYFARPDSLMDGKGVYEVRKAIGAELVHEKPVEADLVIPVPDSGVPAAIGYAQASGIPFELGIIRNHYVGRTFIQPTDSIRHLGVKLKHSPNSQIIKGKRIILVDDSIVRGTTSKKIVDMMRHAGASEVHMRISSPPTVFPCFYGIDTPEREHLMAARMTEAQMAQAIGCDSLAFISMDGLYRAVCGAARAAEHPQYCDACFSGDYPLELTDHDHGLLSRPSVLVERGGKK